MAGRPPYRPTDTDRRVVRERSGLGMPQEAICRGLGISMSTLHKYFKQELAHGQDEANIEVAQSIWNMATGRKVRDDGTIERVDPNPTMAIWWSKTRMGWREPSKDSDAPGAAGNTTIVIRGGLPLTHEDEDQAMLHPKSNRHGNSADCPD
jgi:hypothetical protein